MLTVYAVLFAIGLIAAGVLLGAILVDRLGPWWRRRADRRLARTGAATYRSPYARRRLGLGCGVNRRWP